MFPYLQEINGKILELNPLIHQYTLLSHRYTPVVASRLLAKIKV